MATISPQEAKRVVVAALLHAQVLISTIARQEKVGRAMIYDIKRRLESDDPSDSLSSAYWSKGYPKNQILFSIFYGLKG